MSKLPSKNAFVVPSVGVPQQKTVEENIYETIEKIIQTRYFRRISIIAGVGSVVFAAWYILRKIPVPVSPLQAVEETLALMAHQDHDHLVEAPPEDEKVVIHCCPRGYYTPCIATAPFRLETFLRVAGIPYEVSFCDGSNGHLTPFLSLGSKSADEFRGCLRILSEKFDIDLEKDASASRKTASHLIDIMLDNHFSWGILISRWIYDEGNSVSKIHHINSTGEEVSGDVAAQIKEATKFQPISRYTQEEFVATLFQGLQDISAALGKHQYFMGQNPGIVDCNAFAILSQMMWNMPGSPFESQIRRYSNLVDFVARMRDNYWPDWNQLIGKPEEYEVLSQRDESNSRNASVERLSRRKSSRSRGRDCSQGCKVERVLAPDDIKEFKKRKLGDPPTPVKSQTRKEAETPKSEPEPVPTEKSASASDTTTPVDVEKKESQSQRREEVAPPQNSNLTRVSDTTTANVNNSNSNVQPVGILKSGNTPVVKQRSGLVNVSGANITEQEITPKSDPTLSNLKQQQQPQPSQQVRPPVPVQRKPSHEAPQQAEGPRQQPHPLNQDSVFQVHKNSVKFADNATASVVFAMDEKAEKNSTETTKNSPSYTISTTSEQTPKKTSEIPVRKPNPEPAKRTVAALLHEKQFPTKKGPLPQNQEREENIQKKPETVVDINQVQKLRQQHYQKHMSNVNPTQQQSLSQPTSQQQNQPPPPPRQQLPSAQQQQHQQLRQHQSSPQQQFHQPQHVQQTPNPNVMQQPPRGDTERAVSVNAVNNNNVIMSGGRPQRPVNNYETFEMEASPPMQDNNNIQHSGADRNSQYYPQRPQSMQQGFRPAYGRPAAMYAQSHGAMFPPTNQIRYGPPMTPPGMGMYSHVPLEEYQKVQQAEAYYQDYHYPNGMLPASYVVAEQMTPTMLQRFY